MLEGKVAVITGGTRGIGLAIAEIFLKNKAKVILFGSKKETVTKAIADLKEKNNSCEVEGYYPDLGNKKELEKVFQNIYSQYQKIDILINNAGVSSSTAIDEYTDEEFEKINTINIKGVFNCTKIVVPYMKENGGVILNTSSMVSFYGQSRGCMYPTSKFAINGMTKSLARELGKYQIRVNAIAPGIIETDMVKSLPEHMIQPLIKTIPLGRVGTPEDVANAFLFLASDQASYITGTILQVDGAAIN